MPKPIALRLLVKALERNGFRFTSQKGSHAKYVKGSFTAIVPMQGKEVPCGTFSSILRQSGLSEEEIRGEK